MIDKILEITNPMLLAVGFIFMLMGIIMYKFPPKKINGLYGYRTASSMQSQAKWDFAQKYSAKIMSFIGLGMFALSFTRTLLPFDKDQTAIFGVAILLLSVIILLVIVEKKLKQIP